MKKGEENLTEAERAELIGARQELRAALGKIEHDPKIAAAASRLDEAKIVEERSIHIEREREVMRRIDEYDQKAQAEGKPLGHALVVYGSAHDFTKALEEWNATRSQPLARGLIKLTAREDKPDK